MTKKKQDQALNKFSEPSYGSPQSAIMGKMGMGQPRSLWAAWPLAGVPVQVVKPKRGRK